MKVQNRKKFLKMPDLSSQTGCHLSYLERYWDHFIVEEYNENVTVTHSWLLTGTNEVPATL